MAGERLRVENEAYMAFAGRIIRAAGQRVAEGDPEGFGLLNQIDDLLTEAKVRAVCGLLAQGHSLRVIGAACGMSGQAVFEFHRRRCPLSHK